ncbi:MAG: argininosuccinate lyase, partial [Planctomycetota bacterium]
MSEHKSWQARIAEATDALGQDFVESVSYDWRLYKQDIAGSLAHAAMLAKVGLITEDDRAAIERGLIEIEAEIDKSGSAWPGFDKQYEDIHMCVEKALIDKVGEPGRRLHTGRSRNDQVATDLAMWLGDHTGELLMKLNDVRKSLVSLASRSDEIVMPSYTHLQRAQPISAAAEAMAWFEMLGRDHHRLSECSRESGHFFRPLGSGAIAGTSLPIDVLETSALLTYRAVEIDECGDPDKMANDVREGRGVDDGPTSAIEHTASRDHALDFVYACAMTAMHLSRWAEQWIIYSSAEFGFIKTADKYTTGSSMMPQKRNPDMLELIRGRCGNVYGNLVALLTICKGLPIGYNRDLQEDKRHVFAAYDTVSSCLTMAAAIVNNTEFVKDKCEAACEGGFMDATSLAEYLVVKGVPFRTAHQIVGGLVAKCEREGKTKLEDLTLDEFQAASDVIEQDVFDALGARNVVARYQSAGAAGGEPLRKQLSE